MKRQRGTETDQTSSPESEALVVTGATPVEKLTSLLALKQKEEAQQATQQVKKKIKRDWLGLLNNILVMREPSAFKKVKYLDDGSFSRVFSAKNQETGEIVAIKKLNFSKDQPLPVSQIREIQTLMMCDHQNILKLKEVLRSEYNQLTLVTELCQTDLWTLQKQRDKAPFEKKHTKDFFFQLVEALKYLHSIKIMHRDVKLSNCLLNSDGLVKLADFGLARVEGEPMLQEEEEGSTHPEYTPLVVTLWYRAPELLLASRAYSNSIDMWSAGCVFGELLLGQPLFDASSEIGQLNQIFTLFGTPSDRTWKGFSDLPMCQTLIFHEQPASEWQKNRFPDASDEEIDMLESLLVLDPQARFSAEKVLAHKYWDVEPIREKFLFPQKAEEHSAPKNEES